MRCARYLHPSTEPLLVGILHDCLLVAHTDGILNHPSSGLEHMVEAERVGDLARLYRLFARIPPKGHGGVREALKAWIKARGASINEGLTIATGDESGPVRGALEPGGPAAPTNAALQWVQNVLGLRDKSLGLLANAFAGDKTFQTSINEAFTSFVNANRRAPEYISLFLDDNLRKGLKGVREGPVLSLDPSD